MKTVVMTLEKANQILGYLGTRPWSEANELIALIRGCVVTDEPPKAIKKEEQDGADKSDG